MDDIPEPDIKFEPVMVKMPGAGAMPAAIILLFIIMLTAMAVL